MRSRNDLLHPAQESGRYELPAQERAEEHGEVTGVRHDRWKYGETTYLLQRAGAKSDAVPLAAEIDR